MLIDQTSQPSDAIPSGTPLQAAAAEAAAQSKSAASPPAHPCATLAYLTPVGEFIHSADSKAGTILTVLGIMFTLLARFGSWLDEMIRGMGVLSAVTLVLLAGFAGTALAAVIQSFRTISPRFPKAPASLAFFGDIARLSLDQYLAKTTSLTPEQALSEKLSYNHTGSQIILAKFKQLRIGLTCFAVAASCWLVLVALLACKAFLA